MAVSKQRKLEVRKAIARHLGKLGSDGLTAVQKKYSDIPKRTFWYWVKQLKENPKPEDLRRAKKIITKKARDRRINEDKLPVPMQPGAIAANGSQTVDFLLDYIALRNDANMMRAHAVRTDDDGKEQIRNIRLFNDSAKLRLSLLNTGIALKQDAFETERMQRMFDAIMRRLSERDSMFASQVLEDLEAIVREMGITVSGYID